MVRPDNIPALTGMRAYAAVWVMLLHLQHGVGIDGQVGFGALVDRGGWAVDIFFVLSGFILSLIYAPRFELQVRRDEWLRYLSARFARIYPLHLFALGALALYYFGVRLASGAPLPGGFSLKNFALNLTLLHGWGLADRLSWNYPSWSIGTEWFAYLAMLPLLARGLRRLPAPAVLLLGLVAWTVLYLAIHSLDQTIGTQNVKWGIPRIVVEFTLGYGLYRGYRAWRPSGRVADTLALGGLAAIVGLGFAPPAFEWALAPAVCALVFGLSGAGPLGAGLFGSRRAVFWGERSYSIYMLHAVVQIYSNLVLLHFGLARLSAPGAWLLVLTQAVLVLGVSHLAYGWVELPMRQRLRALLESSAAPAGGRGASRPVHGERAP